MKKVMIWLHFILIFYTLFHLIFFFSNQEVLIDTIFLRSDPLIISVFFLLGLYPLAFLMYAYKFTLMTHLRLTGLLFGFMLGGFTIAPAIIHQSYMIEKKQLYSQRITLFLLSTAVFITLYGLIWGSFTNYISLFTSDSFLHIMTLDFLLILMLSAYAFKDLNKYYLIGLIPGFGLFYLILSTPRNRVYEF